MTVIAVALLAAVFGVEMILRGVPEFVRDTELLSSGPTLTARSHIAIAAPLPATAIATQPAANAVATEQTDEPLPATPTASG